MLRYPRGGGGGGTLIFSYIRRLGHFFGFKLLNFNIFLGFSEKIIFFWNMEIFWDHHKIEPYLGAISMHFRHFLRSMYRIGDIFLGC